MSTPCVYDPFPVKCGRLQLLALIPRQRANPALFFEGQGNISPIANDVNDQRVWNGFFDPGNRQQMVGGAVRPALYTLLAGHGFHDDSQEIARIGAPCHHFFLDLSRVQPGFRK